MIDNSHSPLEDLRQLMVGVSGVAEPRQVAALLANIAAPHRNDPICQFADAIIARTGDIHTASAAHRRAADSLAGESLAGESLAADSSSGDSSSAESIAGDSIALCALLGSWLGIALNLKDIGLVLELRERAAALAVLNHEVGADAIVGTIDAAGLLLQNKFRDAEACLSLVLAHGVPPLLRGTIAMLRSLALQGQGLLDAAVNVLDADAATLGSFDLAAEMVRARRAWINGDHSRARTMLSITVTTAQARGRQHDGAVAAAMGRVFARLAGDLPEFPRPTASTPFIAALLHIDEALALLPDEIAAANYLQANPGFIEAPPELLAVPFVVGAQLRPRIEVAVAGNADPSDALSSARLLVAKRNGEATRRPSHPDVRSLFHLWANELLDQSPPTLASIMDQTVRIRVLGPVGIEIHGALQPIRRERVRALLTLLVLHRRISRERLIDALWPDLAPQSGANNLRATLSYTRRLSTSTFVIAQGHMVWLEAEADLWALDVSTTAARQAAAIGSGLDAARHWGLAAGAIGGRFAEDVQGCHWLDAARFSIDSAAVDALVHAATSTLATQPARSRMCAEQALSIDPWCESAHVILVRSWLDAGDHPAARRAMQRAAEQMNDLGLRPGDALAELADAIG